MLKNLVRGKMQTDISYYLAFDDGNGSGFWFPCDKDGNMPDDMPDSARSNLKRCLADPGRFVRSGEVVSTSHSYRAPDRGICSRCGTEIELTNEYMGACSCPECGQWYNLFGQELMPPRHWREDY